MFQVLSLLRVSAHGNHHTYFDRISSNVSQYELSGSIDVLTHRHRTRTFPSASGGEEKPKILKYRTRVFEKTSNILSNG